MKTSTILEGKRKEPLDFEYDFSLSLEENLSTQLNGILNAKEEKACVMATD